ncbi:SDR family oxidoreductase [Allorhizobium pseudoryzae]|uniref:SDR family oxidoreductase n=1 Tax=Allorhizobium pseudoryzae TaxID=379684 RepID=UPI003D00B95E
MSKVWFITGAGSGIGAATARAALKAGNRVVATGRNLDKVRKALNDVTGDNLAVVHLDVTNEAQAHTAVAEAVEAFGRIDVLVNNAGYSVLGNFEEISAADFQSQLQTNLFGVVNVMRAALPIMRQQRAGRIINISSVAGVIGLKHCSAYSAAKFAVEGVTFSVAHEVEQFGIKLIVVSPGFFRTDLLDSGNVRYAESTIDDYASEGSAEAAYSAYDGQQTGNPAALGEVLVQLGAMDKPPKQFMAGADAIAAVRPVLEERLNEIDAYKNLSRESAGSF